MIGRLSLGDVVTLGDDYRWSCPTAPSLAALFNTLYGPDRYGGPADGFPGPYLFNLAATGTGATVLDAPAAVVVPDDGRVY
jgi:hypothetical protein